jgi:hypothetical protein
MLTGLVRPKFSLDIFLKFVKIRKIKKKNWTLCLGAQETLATALKISLHFCRTEFRNNVKIKFDFLSHILSKTGGKHRFFFFLNLDQS